MRRLRRQLPGLLLVIPLAAPGFYIRIAYGRRWEDLPPWAQTTMTLYLAIGALAIAAAMASGLIWHLREHRRSKQLAAVAALDALRPGDDDG